LLFPGRWLIDARCIDILMGADAGHDRALYAACPCTGKVAQYPINQTNHQDEASAVATIQLISNLNEEDDVWVILAHEPEVLEVVSEKQDLSLWMQEGWKGKVKVTGEKLGEGGIGLYRF
jgi:hypothetical protein